MFVLSEIVTIINLALSSLDLFIVASRPLQGRILVDPMHFGNNRYEKFLKALFP